MWFKEISILIKIWMEEGGGEVSLRPNILEESMKLTEVVTKQKQVWIFSGTITHSKFTFYSVTPNQWMSSQKYLFKSKAMPGGEYQKLYLV